MFRNSYQNGFLTVFYSVGSKPLDLWEVHMENGHVSRLLDPEIKSMVLDIRGYNVSTAYMTCPTKNRILGITMPYMIMIVKNLKKYFTFEVTIMDNTGTRRRFRVSNFQSYTQILPLSTAMPIALADGWNQIQFNLSEFTRRAYGKSFVEVQKIKVNANIRLRRIYFAQRLTPMEDLPAEYRIFLPSPSKKVKKTPVGGSKTNVIKEPSKAMVTSQAMIKTSESRTSILDVPPPVPAGDPEPPQVEAVPTAEVETPTAAPDEAPPEEVALVGETLEEDDVEGETTPGKSEGEGEGQATPGDGETAPGKSEGEGEGQATPGDGETAPGKSEGEGDGQVTPGDGETTPGKSEGEGEGQATPGDRRAEAEPEVEEEQQLAD